MSDKIPHVYVACLACYNAGRLVGKSGDLDTYDADDWTPEEIHSGRMAELVAHDGGAPHEEYVVHDSEYVPINGEFSAGSLGEIADLYADVVRLRSAEEWEAYCAFALHVVGTYLPSAEDFESEYIGHAESFKAWIFDNDCPIDPFAAHPDIADDDDVRLYFNWAQFADDQQSNFNVVSLESGVAIFN